MRLIDADRLKHKITGITKPHEFVEEIDRRPTIVAIPVEWMKNKREELEKEYYDLFHTYTDESRNNQVRSLNDFHAFNTVLRYWEKENEEMV